MNCNNLGSFGLECFINLDYRELKSMTFFVKSIICYIEIIVRIFLFVLFCSMNYCVNWLVDSWFGWILVGIKFCLQGKPPGSAVAYRSLEG